MSNPEILVIDDELAMRKLLDITLESNDYKVTLAETGKEGILLAAKNSPDLILLDLGLPDQSGHQVLQSLRTWYNRPIIILSVQNTESDIVNALDHGANDYMTKPFRTVELLARIRSAIRRNQSENASSLLIFDQLEIDLGAHTVKLNGQLVKLTSTEYKLLTLFVRNEGRVLTHQSILKEIWGVGAQEETQYLRVFVGTLRKKIETDPSHPRHILTESGIGYRFI